MTNVLPCFTDPRRDPLQPEQALRAALLRPVDDVATALIDLAGGSEVSVASGAVTRLVTLDEDIRTGHKFAVRALATGLRVRKYGEYIGRTTRAVPAGAWIHDHNLATLAHQDRNGAQGVSGWYDVVEPASVLQVLGSRRCTVGENPLYDETRDALYWIDVRGAPAIYRLDLTSGKETCWPMPEDIGSVALGDGDTLLTAMRSGFAIFDCATGTLTPLHDPEPGLHGNRLNDGKCDAAGRYWCGSMNPESGTADGSLYVLDRNLNCTKVLDDLFTPNGMTWSADNATMYLSDTRRGFIYAFEFDIARGTLGERRVFADLGAMPGGPDGAAIDAEGYLWSAQVDGGCVIRYAPDGAIDRVVRVPVTKPTSCGFGGPGYGNLYVTTATRGMSEQELRDEPDAGRILVLDVGVAGLAPVRFGIAPGSERHGPGPARVAVAGPDID